MFYLKSVEILSEFTISKVVDVDVHTSLEVDGCSADSTDTVSVDLGQTWEYGDDDLLYEELVDAVKVDVLATPNEMLEWLAEDAGMDDSLSAQSKWWYLAERHGWLPDNIEALQESVEGLEELLEQARHDLAATREELNSANWENAAISQKLTEAIGTREHALASVRAERDQALSELAATREELRATEAERQALDAELEEHAKTITESNAEACRAFDLADKLEAEKVAMGQELTRALALRDQALAAVRAERDEALNDLVELRSDIADKCYVDADSTEAGLQAQITQLRDEVKGRTWQIQQYQQELRIIRVEEQKRFTVNDNLRQQERDLRLEWQNKANQLIFQNRELRQQLEQVRSVAAATLAAFGGE